MARADNQIKLTARVTDKANGQNLTDVFAVGATYEEAKRLLDLAMEIAIETEGYE